jgi:hypothetical protein
MAHMLDRGDVLDLLEEAVVLKRQVAVNLRGDRHFVDHVREVVTRDGDDWVVFKTHETVLLRDIHTVARAAPIEPTYAGKR